MGLTGNFNNYSSHLNVLDKIFSSFSINSVLEFGLGMYSTKYFTEHAQYVISVEQESHEWYDKVRAEIKTPSWGPVFQANPIAVFQYFDYKQIGFDLVFSDGAKDTRCMVANMALERKVPFVVLHDAEHIKWYRWDELIIPAGYHQFYFCCKNGHNKTTSIITNKSAELIEGWNVPEHERVVLMGNKLVSPSSKPALVS